MKVQILELRYLFFLSLIFLQSSCSTYTRTKLLEIKNDTCLLFFESLYQNKKWSCTASLVNSETLLTAAHCGEAFSDSKYHLDSKNKIFGYCRGDNRPVKINANSFLVHPEYSFSDVTTNIYDIALVKINSPQKLSPSTQLLTNEVKIKDLVKKNQCYISGYRDTVNPMERQRTIRTPSHIIYLESIHKKGIKFQNEFDNNKAILHGGLAENELTLSNKEVRKYEYPGLGYSGSSLVCDDNQKGYKVGVYVGGFEKSKTWVSLLFLDKISSWLLENL